MIKLLKRGGIVYSQRDVNGARWGILGCRAHARRLEEERGHIYIYIQCKKYRFKSSIASRIFLVYGFLLWSTASARFSGYVRCVRTA